MPCLISVSRNAAQDTRFSKKAHLVNLHLFGNSRLLKNPLLLLFTIATNLFNQSNALKHQILTNLNQLEVKFNTTGAAENYLNLTGYGCWCKINKDWVTARGVGQDTIDQECRNLLKGYRCVVLDTKSRFKTCDPFLVEYNGYDFNSFETIHSFCNSNNQASHCSSSVCILDANFALTLFEEFQNTPGGLDPQLTHSSNNGDFDHDKVCQPGVFSHVITRQRQCCGEYPHRMPISISSSDSVSDVETRWTCYEMGGFYTPRGLNGSCELDSNSNCIFYSSQAECNSCRLGVSKEYANTIYVDHIYSHHVFGNPRFTLSNELGENFWTDYAGGDLRSDYAIDGIIIQEPRYLFAHVARNMPPADFLLDLDGHTLLNLVTLYPRQDCGCKFERNEHTIVFITDAFTGDDVVCNPRFLYNVAKMEELLSGVLEESQLFFDCERDVVGAGLRVSNQQFYGNGRDNLQIVEIQVGFKN